MREFVGLRAKTYSYLIDDGSIYQRLPIALAQVKAGNTSENLLN